MSQKLSLLLSWLVTILVPLALLMLGVRLLMTPLFLEAEYRMPGFPEDSYGFTLQDRLEWSKPSVEYLLNGESVDFLAKLQFDNGKPIYNERELSHMLDVKKVVQMLLKIWYCGSGFAGAARGVGLAGQLAGGLPVGLEARRIIDRRFVDCHGSLCGSLFLAVLYLVPFPVFFRRYLAVRVF